jgi:hypothetical protein
MLRTLIAAAMAVSAVCGAYAHMADNGWMYSSDCCSGADCYQIKDDDVDPVPNGYSVRATGEIVHNGDTLPSGGPKIRESPDGHYHRCSTAGQVTGHTYCIYVPGGT